MPGTRPLAHALDRPIRLAVLISGGGTTLLNLVAAIERGELDAEIPLVVSSRRDCAGVGRAEAAGLRCEVIRRKDFTSVEQFSEAIFAECRAASVDLVICGGFLALLKVPSDFELRVMNIHPSLIPAFCGQGLHGEHVHAAAIARGAKFSGCTIHFVDDEYDHGPIISQRIVPILETDSPATLAERVFVEECLAYPTAITAFARAELEVEGSRVRQISGGA